jgi:hypothetical protein
VSGSEPHAVKAGQYSNGLQQLLHVVVAEHDVPSDQQDPVDSAVGVTVGRSVGVYVGSAVGHSVGVYVGGKVGWAVGSHVGAIVGGSVSWTGARRFETSRLPHFSLLATVHYEH